MDLPVPGRGAVGLHEPRPRRGLTWPGFRTPSAYREVVEEIGGPSLADADVLAAFAIGSARQMLGALIGRPVASEAVRRYERLLRQRAASVSVYPGVDPVLRALQGRVPLAVFTAADTAAAEILLEATGIRRFFAHVVGADRVSQTKPSPEGLLLMARLLLVEPTRMAYIGDGPADIAAARACGALAVAAAWGHQFDAIVPADQVLEQPADVLRFIRMAPLAASAVPLDLVSELDSDGDSHDGGSG